MARAHGIPHSVFLSWERYDQEQALALHQVEQIEEANRCPVCGGDSRECQESDNQRAYDVHLGRCYRTKAVSRVMDKRKHDKDEKSLIASTVFIPERVKPPAN